MSLVFLYKFSLLIRIFLVSFTKNWIILWIWVELSSVSIVVILRRKVNPRSVEASRKYFIIQSIARLLFLFGIMCHFLEVGNLELFSYYRKFSYLVILISILIKLAVFPNPFWVVDVMRGIRFLEGIYVLVLSKVIPIYLYSLLVGASYTYCVIILGLISIMFGSILGVNQTKVRKIVALSSISHMGWLIVGFPYLSYVVSLYVFILYIIMLIPLFRIASFVNLEHLVKLKKLYNNYRFVLIFIISLLSLGGFPPLVGFFYKWIIFYGLLQKNMNLVCVLLIIFSLVSLYFYLQLIYYVYCLYWLELKIVFINIYKYIGDFKKDYILNIFLVFSIILSIFRIIGIKFLNPILVKIFF